MNTEKFDDFGDDISDLTGGRDDLTQLIDGAKKLEVKQPPASYKPQSYTEGCPRCRGTGRYGTFGKCYACNGAGKKVFKTSPEARAKSRAYAEDRKEAARVALEKETKEWVANHKAEWDWMAHSVVRNPGFEFPAKMIETVGKWGHLTDGQLAAIRKCMARDAAWEEKRQQADAEKPMMDVSRLEAAFASAREVAFKMNPKAQDVWVRPLRVRDEAGIDLSFMPGSPGSEWEGMIFVRDREKKLGWIKDHKFTRRFACTDADEAAISRVVADPEKATKAFAQAYRLCGVCSRTLTNKYSIERGIGPICSQMMGWG